MLEEVARYGLILRRVGNGWRGEEVMAEAPGTHKGRRRRRPEAEKGAVGWAGGNEAEF